MAAKEEEKAENSEAQQPKGKGKKKKLLFIVIGVVVLAAGIGVPMFLMKKGADKKGADKETEEVKEEKKHIKLADLGIFVVNLSESSTFLKVNLKVEYDAGLLAELEMGSHSGGSAHEKGGAGGDEKDDAMPPAMKNREPVIRDAVIRVLSSKHVEEVLTTDGKEKAKEELIEAINEAIALDEPIVTGAFFSEFMVQ